ncbi:MAG: YceD family protein [Promicromonosporaceae bacterium]|nr:YceD family protein [Promicromonosporaceae bacterium]
MTIYFRPPLTLDCSELQRRPGSLAEFARVVPAPADLGTAVIGVPEGADLTLGLRVQSVSEGVLVMGAVRAEAVGECSRCLDEVRLPVTVQVSKLFAYPERVKAAQDAGDDEFAEVESELVDGLADLEPAVRDSIVTALPFIPLCAPDCPGLCPECGFHLREDPDHKHEVLDPRWSTLLKLVETKES